MSRREAKIKAVAGALQAQGLDLIQYARAKAASRERPTPKIRADVAAGALAFAANAGDPLPGLLLKLKYADQHSKETFDRALHIIIRRHGGAHWKKSLGMLLAIASVALFEWMHDECPKCRGHRADKAPPSKGMCCVACNNSGRAAFERKRRWSLVNEIIVEDQRRRGSSRPDGISPDAFHNHWVSRYYVFLDVLRRADHLVGADVDLGFKRSQNAPIRMSVKVADEAPDLGPA